MRDVMVNVIVEIVEFFLICTEIINSQSGDSLDKQLEIK